jgi:acetyltransferase-like isoleucine patch superfamily enzyme
MMRVKMIIRRLLLVPIAIGNIIKHSIVSGTRDLENRLRYQSAIIEDGCGLTVDCTIGSNTEIQKGSIINHTQVGSYSYCGRNCLIQNAIVGNYCSISHDVIIGLGAHPMFLFSTAPVFYKDDVLNIRAQKAQFSEYETITIGSDVWIGARAIVKDGVRIGHGAVIAAAAVVTKDVPDYAIVAGVPAKIIKYRFDKDVCDRLLKTQWWIKSHDEILTTLKELNEICKY